MRKFKACFHTQLVFTLATALILFISLNSCAGQEASIDKLSSELRQLAASGNPEEFAKKHGIPLIDNSVKVVIVAINKFPDITKRYDLKEIRRYRNHIEAIVSIEDLVSLSEEEEVKYIRRPYKLWRW